MTLLSAGTSIREAGDAGLLVELEPQIDPRVNARAIAIAAVIRAQGLTGVLDVVPTYRSVAVHFDPWDADVLTIRRALEDAASGTPPVVSGPLIEVPVVYGGETGPDLESLSQLTGLSRDAIVSRHMDAEYRVFMCGFMPGFAYLGLLDEAIAAPRRATPRVHVPGGSVGIAGRQTGVYPFDSPGGWQLIGRTSMTMFDASRDRPARCAPGDRVRFVRDAASWAPPPARAVPVTASPHAGASITVVHPGLFTTVQDLGRWGHQVSGVPTAGAMDPASLRQANAAAGNEPDAAALEVTLMGPELRFEAAVTVAIAGADLSATLDGRSLPLAHAVNARAGQCLRFGQRRRGGRAYVAVAGGLDVPVVLGSRATHVRSGMGGYAGRPLRAGDRLSILTPLAGQASAPGAWSNAHGVSHTQDVSNVHGQGDLVTLRVLPGPQQEWFTSEAYERLAGTAFTVHPQSDRMGARLAAAVAIPRASPDEMISDATFPGAIQVPPSGEPILLLADRPTTGGYPQLAVVISADLSRAGQLLPGDAVRFELCPAADARSARGAMPAGPFPRLRRSAEG
jgi:KipI family sensor histidine kinase inhibitor